MNPDEMRAHLAQANAEVSALCHGRKWTMCVPAEPERDSDLVIARALTEYGRLLALLTPERMGEALYEQVRLEVGCGSPWNMLVAGKVTWLERAAALIAELTKEPEVEATPETAYLAEVGAANRRTQPLPYRGKTTAETVEEAK